MQIFLPDPNVYFCASILDSRRVCKQIVEAYQILTGRFPNENHPAILTYGNKPKFLAFYINVFCEEYTKRYGKIHSIHEKIINYEKNSFIDFPESEMKKVYFTHKINLLRKDFTYYSKVFTDIEENSLVNFPDGYYWLKYKKGGNGEKHSKKWNKFFIKNNF